MLSDASLYSKHRSMQIHDASLFLRSVASKMDWSRMEQDVVMDLGCGPGSSCIQILLPAYPRVRKVIAVDVLPDMIDYAKKNNAHEKVEYHVADIENRNTIEKWTGQISKVLSIYCFNWLDNQKDAFANIHHVLKPGGEAALLFMLSSRFYNPYQEHIENPRWNKYLKNANPRIPESHFKKYRAPHYRKLLEEIGFEVILCEDEERGFAYPDDEDARAAVFSRCGLTSYIPDELKEEFKEDAFQAFLKHSGRNSEGRPVLHYTVINILVRKPFQVDSTTSQMINEHERN